MITHSDTLAGILAGYSWQVHYRLSSWLGGACIAEDIPAVDVVEDGDVSLRVPERLSFRVPIEDDQGNIWVPTSYYSPLGWFGQRIVSQLGVSVGNGAVEWLNRGVFLLESADTDGDSVSVEALGLSQLLDEAQLATEFQPAAGATLKSTVRQLIEPGIPVDFTSAPTDRSIPSSAVTWSDNRLDCVYTIMDAWPAQIRQAADGTIKVTSVPSDPVSADVVVAFTDDAAGTVVQWNTGGTRDGSFNSVIAQGQYADDRGALAGLPIVHTALDTDINSPYSLYGEFSPYLVPHEFTSPLLNEHAETLLAANTKLRDLRRKASRTVRITAAPHPAITLNDAVSVTSTRLGLAGDLGRVDAFRLPHAAEGGAMELTVRLSGLL